MRNICQNLLTSEHSGSQTTSDFLRRLGARKGYPVMVTGTVTMTDGAHSVVPKVHASLADAVSSSIGNGGSELRVSIENHAVRVEYLFEGGSADLTVRKLSSKGQAAVRDGVPASMSKPYWFCSIPGSDVLG